MFYKRLCDQWHYEAEESIAAQEKQQRRKFTEKEKAIFRSRGKHRFEIPKGAHWGDVKAASTNSGEILTTAMRAVSNANEELRGVFTVDWNQPAPDFSREKSSGGKGNQAFKNPWELRSRWDYPASMS